PERHREAAARAAQELLALCAQAHERARAEIILAGFVPLPYHDLGPYRVRSLGSDWSFPRLVNLELGATAPPFVHLCDLEFLAARRGLLAARDERAWFESKQLGAPDLLVDVAREIAHLVQWRRRPSKKVLVLDLDETLWGGVIGDDGMQEIEIGDTSPRGEA